MSGRTCGSVLIVFAVVCGAVPALAAGIVDKVRLARGSETGEVSESTPLEVTLNKGEPGSRTVAVNQIKSIAFEGEPAELAQARLNVVNGAFAKAQQLLEKIDASQVRRDLIKQDLEFYQAFVAAKLATGGESFGLQRFGGALRLGHAAPVGASAARHRRYAPRRGRTGAGRTGAAVGRRGSPRTPTRILGHRGRCRASPALLLR